MFSELFGACSNLSIMYFNLQYANYGHAGHAVDFLVWERGERGPFKYFGNRITASIEEM